MSKAHYLAAGLATAECPTENTGEFFHEFITSSHIPSGTILKALDEQNILGGLPLDDRRILWCCTEMNTKEEMDQVIRTVREVSGC